MAEKRQDMQFGDVALLRAEMYIDQTTQGNEYGMYAVALGEDAEEISLKEMKRFQKRQCTWLTTGYITVTAGTIYALCFLDICSHEAHFYAGYIIPGITLLGMSAASFVFAHNNSLKAKRYAPDLTQYQIGRLRSIGKALAITGAANLVAVIVLDKVLTADTDLIGFATPALGFGIASAACFIKANEKQKKLSVGATVLSEPTGFGKSVARPALSLCLNF